jgi:hypothetical protein
MRRIAIHHICENQNNTERRIRENKISIVGRRALREVQAQFDALITQILDAKILLAGLAIGGDDVRDNTNIYGSDEEELI